MLLLHFPKRLTARVTGRQEMRARERRLNIRYCALLWGAKHSSRTWWSEIASPMADSTSNPKQHNENGSSRNVTYWRVEGSLLELGALRPVGFFTWNAQSFSERWARRAGMAGMTVTRPFAYAANRTFATRLLHTLLRGVSRDRLDLLGEEY